MTCSKAEQMVWEAITFQQRLIPDWLLLNTTSYGREVGQDVWMYTICLCKKMRLKEGQSWERQSNGSKSLLWIDPGTGERFYTIHYKVPDEELIVLFEAEANIKANQVTFLGQTVLTNLDPGNFELIYEEPYSSEHRGLLDKARRLLGLSENARSE